MENKLIIVLGLMISAVSSREWYTQNNPLIVDYTNQKQLILQDKAHIKIIKYFTPWCNYCRYLKPAFDQLKQKYQNSQVFKFYQVNCQTTPQLCEVARITTYPSLLFLNGNTQIMEQIIGYDPPEEFKILVEKILASLNPKILKEQNPKQIKEPAKGKLLKQSAKIETPSVPTIKEQRATNSKQVQIQKHGNPEKKDKGLFGWMMHLQSLSQMLAYLVISVVGWVYFKSVLTNKQEVRRWSSDAKSLQICEAKQEIRNHEKTIVKFISV